MNPDVRTPTRFGRMPKLLRSVMLLVLAASCLSQPAHASGTLYVTLKSGVKVVKFPIPQSIGGTPNPTDVVMASAAPLAIAINGNSIFYNDEFFNNMKGYTEDAIRRMPLTSSAGMSGTASIHAISKDGFPRQMAFDSSGTLYFPNGPNIVRVDSQTSTSAIVASLPSTARGYGAVFDGASTLYVSSTAAASNPAIYKITVPLAPPSGPNAVLPSATLLNVTVTDPRALAMDRSGRLYIGDVRVNPTTGQTETIIWRLDPKGSNQVSLFSVLASINELNGLTFDDVGNLYATVGAEHKIFKIDPSGNSTLFHSFVNRCQDSGGGPTGCYPWGLAFVPDPTSSPPLKFLEASWQDLLKWAIATGTLLYIVLSVVTILRRRHR